VSASVSVRTYQGDMRSSFPTPAEAGESRRGRRQTFTLGNGAAQIEMESFGGDVRIRKVGEVSLEPKRKHKHEQNYASNETCQTGVPVP
jgi:hypothetical protein